MARPSSKDPLDRFRWRISIEGFTRMGFSTCDVPSYAITTKKYTEGGAHLYPKQIVDSIEYKPVTLTRGVTADRSFQDWATQALEFARGESKHPSAEFVNLIVSFPLEPGRPDEVDKSNTNVPLEYRRTVTIDHLNRTGQIVKTYILYNAFPIEFAPASNFASDGDDVLSMEKITLAYESFEVCSEAGDSNPFDIRGLTKRIARRGF
jgi:phage tail-like protein